MNVVCFFCMFVFERRCVSDCKHTYTMVVWCYLLFHRLLYYPYFSVFMHINWGVVNVSSTCIHVVVLCCIRCSHRPVVFTYVNVLCSGGWPFSTAAHGWPISDCTAEGLKAVLALHQDGSIPAELRIPDQRLFDACNIMLSYQNEDGGWATYENNRGYRWYEMLNPSEVFGDIMIDYSYVECSSACITALKAFRKVFPNHRSNEVNTAIAVGGDFLKSIQRPDGSWYGSWGNCFTYGTWFGIEGLVAAGMHTDASEIQKAMQFLLRKQNPNGGWGESYLSCVNKTYTPDGTGEVRHLFVHRVISYTLHCLVLKSAISIKFICLSCDCLLQTPYLLCCHTPADVGCLRCMMCTYFVSTYYRAIIDHRALARTAAAWCRPPGLCWGYWRATARTVMPWTEVSSSSCASRYVEWSCKPKWYIVYVLLQPFLFDKRCSLY